MLEMTWLSSSPKKAEVRTYLDGSAVAVVVDKCAEDEELTAAAFFGPWNAQPH